MKSVTGNILWAIATLGSMILTGYAGYMALHSTGRMQSGWDMMLFIAIAVMLMLFDLQSPKNEWLPKVLGIASILFAIIFGIHYFGGNAAIKSLLTWQW